MLSVALFGAAAVSVAVHWRRLPTQNLVAIAMTLFLAACGVELLASSTGIPFRCLPELDKKVLGFLPLPGALAWLLVVVNGRGFAELTLRQRRTAPFYGWYLLVVGSVLVAAFWLVLALALGAHKPWSDLPGRCIAGALLLIVCIPWLLEKRDAFAEQAIDEQFEDD